MMSKSKGTEGMKRMVQDTIDQVYKRGFKDGEKQSVMTVDSAIDYLTDEGWMYEHDKEMYEQGLNNAWEAARKSFDYADDGVFTGNWAEDIIKQLSPSQAISRIKAYEEQKKAENKAVNVGDEVFFDGGNGVVIDEISDDEVYIFNDLGCVEKMEKRLIVKTKRTFPQIAEVLKQLQEGE